MKYSLLLKTFMLAVLVLVAANSMAADKINKTTITIVTPTTVAGRTLAPGDYQVTWEGDNGQVQMNIVQNKKVVASVPATIQARNTKFDDTTFVCSKKGDANELTEVRPRGKSEALVVTAAPGA